MATDLDISASLNQFTLKLFNKLSSGKSIKLINNNQFIIILNFILS